MAQPSTAAARRQRAKTLAALYQADLRDIESPAAGLGGRAKRYVEGVVKHRDDLDRRLEEASQRWPVHRMPVVDRAILRLGLYELLHEQTPTAVVINEAVELAKHYSTGESGGFINGVLANLARQIRCDEGSPE